jgi:ABC-type multidrug transport system ATPase subunit
LISVSGIKKSYGAIKVLEGLDLEVKDGQTTCILGKSGSGKTTLLKIIALIALPDSGSVTIDGRTFRFPSKEKIPRPAPGVSYSFQEPLLVPFLDAVENITRVIPPSDLPSGWTHDDVESLLSRLGLGERLHHSPKKLSVGEKKRVDIARALLKPSKVLLADEPFSNLDPDSRERVASELKNFAMKGGTVVYSAVAPEEGRYADFVLNFKLA